MKTGNLIDDELQLLKAERALLAEERNRLQRHLLTMATLLDAVLQRETKALAHELHDDLGQVLTALRMDIALLMLQHQADTVLVGKANGMLALMDRCMQTVCSLINVLRPVDFEHGFVAALEELCRNLKQQHNLSCGLNLSFNCNRLDDGQAQVLFRILREALTNIVQHAMPCAAIINLSLASDKSLEVEISDNGCGFDVSATTSGERLGLVLMRESAVALGAGTGIGISSEIGVGTKVVLHIPAESLKQQ